MLQKSKIQIAFIQETHFRSDNIPKLYNHYFPTVYHASTDDSKTKGVAILISKNYPLQVSEVRRDSNGRFLFLKGTLHNRPITLANIYAPNKHQVSFFRDSLHQLTELLVGISMLHLIPPRISRQRPLPCLTEPLELLKLSS